MNIQQRFILYCVNPFCVIISSNNFTGSSTLLYILATSGQFILLVQSHCNFTVNPMEPDNYYYSYKGKDKYHLYFAKTPMKDWSYANFEQHFSGGRNLKKNLITNYIHCLALMKDDKNVPVYAKEYIDNIMKEVKLLQKKR